MFILGLAVIVAATSGNGLATAVRAVLPGGTTLAALLGIASISALLANLVSNLPAILVIAPVAAASGPATVLAALVGVNVGPNLTYTGSLATLPVAPPPPCRGHRRAPRPVSPPRCRHGSRSPRRVVADAVVRRAGRPLMPALIWIVEETWQATVATAAADADLIVLARDADHAHRGPRSLGPAARYVVDHARLPCSSSGPTCIPDEHSRTNGGSARLLLGPIDYSTWCCLTCHDADGRYAAARQAVTRGLGRGTRQLKAASH